MISTNSSNWTSVGLSTIEMGLVSALSTDERERRAAANASEAVIEPVRVAMRSSGALTGAKILAGRRGEEEREARAKFKRLRRVVLEKNMVVVVVVDDGIELSVGHNQDCEG